MTSRFVPSPRHLRASESAKSPASKIRRCAEAAARALRLRGVRYACSSTSDARREPYDSVRRVLEDAPVLSRITAALRCNPASFARFIGDFRNAALNPA